jgi:hypothetical protein
MGVMEARATAASTQPGAGAREKTLCLSMRRYLPAPRRKALMWLGDRLPSAGHQKLYKPNKLKNLAEVGKSGFARLERLLSF